MKPAITLVLGFLITLPACSRIEDLRMALQRRSYLRSEQAFHADMDRIAKDTHRTYQLDYVVTDEWMPNFLATRSSFRALEDGKFDMAPWLRGNGVEPSAVASAIFDPNKRTVTIIDTGPNIALIETINEPLRPDRYRSIKITSSPKP